MNRQWIVFAFHFSSCSASREEGLLRTVGPLPALALSLAFGLGQRTMKPLKLRPIFPLLGSRSCLLWEKAALRLLRPSLQPTSYRRTAEGEKES